MSFSLPKISYAGKEILGSKSYFVSCFSGGGEVFTVVFWDWRRLDRSGGWKSDTPSVTAVFLLLLGEEAMCLDSWAVFSRSCVEGFAFGGMWISLGE